MAGAFAERRGADPLGEAYAYCQQVARRHYENFPVASWLLPPEMRPHVAAVYAFARLADDFADEGTRDPADRERLLDDWLERLHAVDGDRAHGADRARRSSPGVRRAGCHHSRSGISRCRSSRIC